MGGDDVISYEEEKLKYKDYTISYCWWKPPTPYEISWSGKIITFESLDDAKIFIDSLYRIR